MHRCLDKNTGSAHFRSQRMQDFVLKIHKKIRGSRPSNHRARRGDICSHPPRAHLPECWNPSASSRLAIRPCSAASRSTLRSSPSVYYNIRSQRSAPDRRSSDFLPAPFSAPLTFSVGSVRVAVPPSPTNITCRLCDRPLFRDTQL